MSDDLCWVCVHVLLIFVVKHTMLSQEWPWDSLMKKINPIVPVTMVYSVCLWWTSWKTEWKSYWSRPHLPTLSLQSDCYNVPSGIGHRGSSSELPLGSGCHSPVSPPSPLGRLSTLQRAEAASHSSCCGPPAGAQPFRIAQFHQHTVRSFATKVMWLCLPCPATAGAYQQELRPGSLSLLAWPLCSPKGCLLSENLRE